MLQVILGIVLVIAAQAIIVKVLSHYYTNKAIQDARRIGNIESRIAGRSDNAIAEWNKQQHDETLDDYNNRMSRINLDVQSDPIINLLLGLEDEGVKKVLINGRYEYRFKKSNTKPTLSIVGNRWGVWEYIGDKKATSPIVNTTAKPKGTWVGVDSVTGADIYV